MKKMEEHHVVGFFRQCIIIVWKNSILFKRNVSGTISELFVSLFFCFLILLMRYIVDVNVYADQNSTTNPSTYLISNMISRGNRSLILYYPDNSYVKSIVYSAITIISALKPLSNITSNTKRFILKNIFFIFNFLNLFEYVLDVNEFDVNEFDVNKLRHLHRPIFRA